MTVIRLSVISLCMRSKFASWLPDAALFALLAAFALAFYWRIVTPDPAMRATFPSGDFVHQFYSFTVFEAKAWWAGRLPLWNPYTFAGHPFLADVQSAIFYPPSLLTVWLALIATGGDFPFIALELEAIAHIFLASIFTYAYIRRVTGHRGAGLIAGLTFGYGGYLTGYPPLQLAVLETNVWLPLVLLLLHKALAGVGRGHEQPGGRGEKSPPLSGSPAPLLPCVSSALAAGLALGVAILAGHPQSAMYVVYVTLLYFAFLAWPQRRAWRRLLALLALLILAAFGVAAVQWLPSLEYAQLSTRALASYNGLSSGFTPSEFVQMLIPGRVSVWSPLYVGILPLALAVIALGLRPTRAVAFWGALTVVALLLSLGGNGFIYPLFYRFVPGFNIFRSQERAAFVVSFALAVLAGYGTVALFRMGDERIRRTIRRISQSAGLIAVVALAALLWLAFAWHGQPQDATTLRNALMMLALWLVAALALIWAQLWMPERVWFALAAGLIALDLFLANSDTNMTTTPLPEFSGLDPLVAQVKADPGVFRTANESLLHPSYGMLAALEDAWGISPLHLQRYDDFTRMLTRRRRWQLLNVKYVFTWRGDMSRAVLMGREGEGENAIHLQQLTDFRERAFFVDQVEFIPDDSAALARLNDPAFNPDQVAIVAGPVALAEGTAPQGGASASRVRITDQGPGWLTLDVETERERLLVISEQAYPGWRAWLDGREAPITRADVILQAVVVPAGRHRVEMRFDPWTVKIGLAITLLTLLLSGGGLAIAARRRAGRVAAAGGQGSKGDPEPGSPVLSPPAPRPPRPPAPLLLVAGLALLAFGLRIWRLDAQALHGDEAFSVLFASTPPVQLLQSMLTTEPNPPLYWFALRVWMALAGRSEFSVRLLSALFSTATIPLLYLFGRRLFGRRAGLLTAFLGAINPFYVWYAQETRMYAMMAALALSSLVFFLRFIAPGRSAHRAPTVGLVVTTTLALYTHYFAALIWLAENIIFFLTPGWRGALKSWARAQAAIAALFAPWLAFVAPSLLQHEKSWISPLSLVEMVERALAAYSLGTTVPEAMAQPLVAGFALIALLGLAAALRRERLSGAIAALILTIPLAAVYLVSLRRPAFHERYLIVIVPAYLALLGQGVAAFWLRSPSRPWAVWIVSGLMLALIGFGSAQGITHYHYDPAFAKAPDWRGLVRTLQAQVGPSDVVVQNFPDPALPYYLGGDRLIVLPAHTPVDRVAESEALRATLATHDRLWLLPYPNPGWDRDGFVKNWLDRRARKVWEGQPAGFDLVAYRRAESPTPSHPADWRLGESIRLIGYDIQALAGAGQVRLTLYWQCVAPVDITYTVFTHVLTSSGGTVAQHDSWPQQGAFPTSEWLPGDVVPDEHLLTLPDSAALADLTIEVGLYELESGQRLPVFASDGQRVAGDQVFLPVSDPG